MSLVIAPGMASAQECAKALKHPMLRRDVTRTQTHASSLGAMVGELRRRSWVRVMHVFGRSPRDLWPDLSVVVIMPPGDSMVLHADNVRREGDAWVPNHTPHRLFTSLLYLDQVDGGELYFPHMRVSIEPRPGLFVAFPCGREWEHQVLPVKRGWRPALSMWYTDDARYRA